jgi:hypothetical protein
LEYLLLEGFDIRGDWFGCNKFTKLLGQESCRALLGEMLFLLLVCGRDVEEKEEKKEKGDHT